MKQQHPRHKARPTLYLHTKVEKNGKLVWRYIKHTPENVAAHPNAKAYIHERDEQHKHKWVPVASGDDLSDSLNAARRRALNRSWTRQVKAGRDSLEVQVDKYIRFLFDTGKVTASNHARVTLHEFLEAVDTRTVRDAKSITREHIVAYKKFTESKGNGERTVYNRYMRILFFMHHVGIDTRPLSKELRNTFKRPKTKLPDIYTPSEVEALYGAAKTTYESVLLHLGLRCGLRYQELKYAQWANVDFEHRVIKLTNVNDVGFVLKDNEEREIPLGSETLATLQRHRAENPKARWILGTMNNTPTSDMLRKFKRIAKRAGVKNAGLHRMRRTFATVALRSGRVDARTVQHWMGHASLETTLLYLKPASSEEMREVVDTIF